DGRGRLLAPLDAVLSVGSITALTGPSGSGKSTLLAALAGFVPFEGSLLSGGEPVTGSALRECLAWAGQRPDLLPGTVGSNVELGTRAPDAERVRRALRIAGATWSPSDASTSRAAGSPAARALVWRSPGRCTGCWSATAACSRWT
ncbi:ATP-binding cassette domain-containing protein, partial [Rathayibacter tanaceti]|uniref:ATP-binding cassette domain-containing protein n=1 Tax=Rathayibacter tanaceti TaxID=1671680 RepID=UPI0012902288